MSCGHTMKFNAANVEHLKLKRKIAEYKIIEWPNTNKLCKNEYR